MNVLQEILECKNPAILVKASAGTGKTYTMIEKIKHEVEVNGVKPENIMVSTFTVDAANEIKKRLPESCLGITSGTLHSIMLNVIKNNGSQSWFVMDSVAQQKIAFGICKENKLSFDKMSKYLNMIGFLKNTEPDYYQMLKDEVLPGMDKKEFATFVKEYWAFQQKWHKIDFADMLLMSLDIFRNKPDVLARYQAKWKYLFVDECQDLSPVQIELINLLTGSDNHLFAVGDSKQSIFSFQGSDMRFIQDFDTKYNNCAIFNLPITYRCPVFVTEKSNLVASHIDGSKIETNSLIEGEIIRNTEFDTWSEEAHYIGNRAIELLKNTQESVRIIFRTNAQALNFQLMFIKNNIPFSSNYNNNIFNRKEVKIGLALCDFLFDYDSFNIAQKLDILKLVKFFLPTDVGYHNFIYDAKKKRLDPMKEAREFPRYEHFIDELEILKRKMSNLDTPCQVFNNISGCKFFNEISDGAEDNLIGVGEFFRDANNMKEARALIDIISKPRDVSKTERCIILSTVHGSKGLESENVFVSGVADGLFPLSSGEQDEECRLFYVAITRSQKNLWITGCKSFGKREFETHSFADMIFPKR